jgi:hypothetical protein
MVMQMKLRVKSPLHAGIDVCRQPAPVDIRLGLVLHDKVHDVAMSEVEEVVDGVTSYLIVIRIDA